MPLGRIDRRVLHLPVGEVEHLLLYVVAPLPHGYVATLELEGARRALLVHREHILAQFHLVVARDVHHRIALPGQHVAEGDLEGPLAGLSQPVFDCSL